MCAGNDFVSIDIRRLSTESYASSSAPSATRWVWYWQADDKSWKEYGYGEIVSVCHSINDVQRLIDSFDKTLKQKKNSIIKKLSIL